MKISKVIVSVAAFGLGLTTQVYGYSQESFSSVCGRLVRANLRFPPNLLGPVIGDGAIGTENVDELLAWLEKSGVWKKFSFEQKLEFTFIACLDGDLQGGPAVQLAQLVGLDGTEIGRRLNALPDQSLRLKFGFDSKAIKGFRRSVGFVTGQIRIR